MKILLVHGMARTPLSMWGLARALRRPGIETEYFGYLVATQSFDEIVARLKIRLTEMADDEYIVIGHSLGGVLLRAAVATLPEGVRRPRRIIMLATPNHSPRLAQRLHRVWWYRMLNGDPGQWLADEAQFASLPPLEVPCTIIAGTRGINGRWSPFGADANDGLVAVTEAELDGAELIELPLRHPFIMNDQRVREVVLARCFADRIT